MKTMANIAKILPDPEPMLNAAPELIVKFNFKKDPINFIGSGPKYLIAKYLDM